MGKHHTEDYKLSAVKFALRTGNQVETCEVFDCSASLKSEISDFDLNILCVYNITKW